MKIEKRKEFNDMFNLTTAQRSKSKLRLGISGSSGSGKTYSALKIAYKDII